MKVLSGVSGQESPLSPNFGLVSLNKEGGAVSPEASGKHVQDQPWTYPTTLDRSGNWGSAGERKYLQAFVQGQKVRTESEACISCYLSVTFPLSACLSVCQGSV